MLLLFLSQGTPLLYGGDELENSQMGNNNAYCQDNEIGWIDWKKGRSYSQFTGFVKDLIRFRKDHPILHMPQELRPTDYKSPIIRNAPGLQTRRAAAGRSGFCTVVVTQKR